MSSERKERELNPQNVNECLKLSYKWKNDTLFALCSQDSRSHPPYVLGESATKEAGAELNTSHEVIDQYYHGISTPWLCGVWHGSRCLSQRHQVVKISEGWRRRTTDNMSITARALSTWNVVTAETEGGYHTIPFSRRSSLIVFAGEDETRRLT